MIIRKKLTYILFVVLFGFISCKRDTKKGTSFKYPIYLTKTAFDTILENESLYMSGNDNIIINKYALNTDSIIILKGETARINNLSKDVIGCDGNFDKIMKLNDSLKNDGLEIYFNNNPVAYKSDLISAFHHDSIIGLEHYPCYIVNETKNDKLLKGKDSHIYAIQEAQDSNGHWFPIENYMFDFCGNGGREYIIHSNEYMLVLFRKYHGNYKTKIRVVIENNNCIYTSNAISGYINYSQFYLNRRDDYERYKKKVNQIIYGRTFKDFEVQDY